MMRTKTTLAVAIAVVLAAGATAAGLLASHGGGTQSRAAATRPQARKKTYAELVAANYKILKPAQTKRLLEYADAAYACLSKQIDIGRPQPSPTKIVMTLPAGAKAGAVARLGVRCSTTIGDPPRDSSFQIRGHAVILYLPKYCILDRKTAVGTKPLPKP